MSDGMIGDSHVTIPDLLEPVVGFRAFRVHITLAREAYVEERWTGPDPNANPFTVPPVYIVDPLTGRAIPDYAKIAEAQKKWQASLGHMHRVEHPAIKETTVAIASPNQVGHFWVPGKIVAECHAKGAHKSPAPDCGCGLYSYYDNKKLAWSSNTVIGLVTQWGNIEAHATGMRSEFMKIEALHGSARVIKAIAQADMWKDEVLFFPSEEATPSEFASLATEFGSPMPEAMRPKDTEPHYDHLYQQMRHGGFAHPPLPPPPKHSKLFNFIGSKRYWGIIAGVDLMVFLNAVIHII